MPQDFYVKEEKKKEGGKWMVILAIGVLLFSAFFFFYTKYPHLFQAEVASNNINEISPRDSIEISFSKPVVSNYFGWEVKIYPEVKFRYRLENYNQKLIIIPEKYWIPEEKYRINVSGRNVFLQKIEKETIFETIKYPKLINFFPNDGQKDVSLDIEDPIQAFFDKKFDDFRIKFVINPFEEVDVQINKENNSVSLMPKNDLKRGESYNIKVHARYKEEGEDNYRKIGEVTFWTKSLPPPTWDKDFSVRLEQAKKFTEAKIKEGKYIDINLTSQVMTIFENGLALDAYLVSTGKRGMETPQGNFEVHNKVSRAWSKKYGLYMPYWMAMVSSGDFGIHELPEWPGGYKEGVNHLGIPVSHGCIRLGVGSAERVYSWAEIGTPVVIHS